MKVIPASLMERVPLMKPEWMEVYNRMGEHVEAPKWNTQCGDRLTAGDLAFVREFAAGLENRPDYGTNPPESVVDWCRALTPRSEFFRQRLEGLDLPRHWGNIKPMTRADMQSRLEYIVPSDADLSRLVINPTSGTTGHPIPAPNHPADVGCYDPLIQYALRMNGLRESCAGNKVAAIQVCAQQRTITYHTVHSYLDGAGFAKINLEASNWRRGQSPGIYIKDMQPLFLSGDPYSFLEYINAGIEYRPNAVLSTALTLESAVRDRLEGYFRCPVVDMYSLNETGPIAYSCPHDPGKFHILPHDIFVEVVSEQGEPLPEGESGMIAVTGGRNPYLPLLRYITGDSASMKYGRCTCGETSPSLVNLQGRKMVLFRRRDGSSVNSIDISGIVRSYPVYFFRFIQREDYSCELGICAGGEFTRAMERQVKEKISALFGSGVDVNIDRALDAGGKFLPFECRVIML